MVRGPHGGRTTTTTTTRGRAATVRVEDAVDGRGLPPPSPATGPFAGGRSRGPRRQGETIAKGHKNYELMLNLQLGIRLVPTSPVSHWFLLMMPSKAKMFLGSPHLPRQASNVNVLTWEIVLTFDS